MNTIVKCALTAALVALLASETRAQGGDIDALMQTSRDWSRAAATGNLEAIVEFWADDAVVYAPDRAPITGKAAIRDFVAESMRIPGFTISWEPRSGFVSSASDLGYLLETNQVTFNDASGNLVTVPGKAVTIWRKTADGRWRCVVDTWNTNGSLGTDPK